MHKYTGPKEIEPENTKSILAKRYSKIGNWMLGGLATISIGAGIYGLFVSQNETDENPSLENPIVACAFNMVNEQATLNDAELAVSRCDTQANLNDLQVTIMGHEVLKAIQE